MLMVMASELPPKSKRKKIHSILIALKQNAYLLGLTASVKHFTRICGHTIPEPYCQKVRDTYLTILKASSTAMSGVPPNYTDRLQPMICIYYNKRTQY